MKINYAITKDNKRVHVGDTVSFKADIEQWGEIVEIQGSGKMATLRLYRGNGFEGDYIGGETYTDMESRRCFYEG